eukprot:TRINITY_DN54672_c0_g1_i1.p1 TRINITY_DN54672_c0_g1~~TRINITY_DN54672_c0_g1_i1.p1  ORF type:complete len:211 (+),score=16.93 TRINITY_DN54672_c0_g1_i1:75-707(+)
MDSWVKDIPKGRGRGKGNRARGNNGQSFGSSSSSPPKKNRTDDDRLSRCESAIKAVGANSVSNSRAIRMLQGLASNNVLSPADQVLENASAVEPTNADPILAHLRSFAIMSVGFAQHSKVSSEARKILSELSASIPDTEALRGKVLMCRVQPCHDNPDMFKVQFSVSPEIATVATALITALTCIGGVAKFLGPPRLHAEREAIKALKLIA